VIEQITYLFLIRGLGFQQLLEDWKAGRAAPRINR
jgi:hypothetical protein